MFLENFWYVAAWSEEIAREPFARVILGQPIVFFRKRDGAVVAVEDRCPHRGLFLHKGRVVDDRLQCGYHGLTFDGGGRCVGVPGQSEIPARADLRSFPITERWGLVWIWMGREGAARRPLPDWSFLDDPRWFARGEYLHLACDYRLITDNLLDLTHLTYVHPHTLGSAAKLEQVQVSNRILGDSVVNSRWLIDIAPPPTYARGRFAGNVDRWQITTFEPPAFASLFAGAAATGTGAPEGNFAEAIGLRTFNAMTPETARSTHYFWALAQERVPADAKLADEIFGDIRRTVQEDVAIFTAHQQSLELDPERPLVAIKSDAALLAARKILERHLREERAAGERRRDHRRAGSRIDRRPGD